MTMTEATMYEPLEDEEISLHPQVESIAKMSKLDFEVELRPLTTVTGNQEPLPVDMASAVVRTDNDFVFGVVGRVWRPVQNREFLDVALRAADVLGRPLESVRPQLKGLLVHGSVDLGPVEGSPLAGEVRSTLWFVNRHDSRSSLHARVTLDAHYQNMWFPIGGLSNQHGVLSIRHTTNEEKRRMAVTAAVEMSTGAIDSFLTQANRLHQMTISHKLVSEVVQLLRPTANPEVVTSIVDRFMGAQLASRWDLYVFACIHDFTRDRNMTQGETRSFLSQLVGQQSVVRQKVWKVLNQSA